MAAPITDTVKDGRRSRWSQHNEDRRRRIIEAAITVIERSEPGSEVNVSAIAAEAGVGRTVVYRHFEDRADLDRAVQQQILDGLWAELLPAVDLDGTVRGIILRIVGTYVQWAVAHPALHALADHDNGDDPTGPLQQGMEGLATQIAMVVGTGIAALGADLDDDEVEAIDPLIFGLIGAVFGGVRRWLTRAERTLSAERLIELTSDSVWFVLQGHARNFGVEIDPDVSLDKLFSAQTLAEVPPVAEPVGQQS